MDIRQFLGWNRPALAAAVDYLAERFASRGTWDLGGVVLAVPGRGVGRRLLELLVQRATEARLTLVPPEIVTVGALPERLYQAKRPFAGELVQNLAWVEALRSSDRRALEPVLPALPAADDLEEWLALARMLGRLHRELAAEALDCRSVADCGANLPGFREEARWQALAAIQQRYLRVLDGLELWDLQTARLFAIRHVECRSDSPIVLVGTPDLNQAQRMMLDQVREQVTALVFAPPEARDRFDDHGCLRPEAWQAAAIELSDDRIEVVDDAAAQAEAVVRAIAAWGGRYSAEEIALGVPDERIIPDLQRRLAQFGLRTRYGAGTPLGRSGPYRLLAAVAEYAAGERFSAFAALVRHPDLDRWLLGRGIRGDWLTQLDRFHSEHLPYRLTREVLRADEDLGLLRRVFGTVRELVHGLLQPEPRRLSHWAGPVLDLLVEVFGGRPLDTAVPADRATLAACEEVKSAAEGLVSVPGPLMPSVTGAAALRLILRELESGTVPPPADRGALELLGWLELPLDDAPAMVVTGLNEGIVPSSLNADLFLPNRLRRALGIEDNDARDAYALTLLTASRADWKLIAGRRTGEGEPLTPSRLLFACDEETIARRTRAYFKSGESGGGPIAGPLRSGRATTRLDVPRPKPLAKPVESMRVTEFRDYLACKYRYYLRHRLGLGAIDDAAEELDGGLFGSLAHEVLCRFGAGPLKASERDDEILAWLNAALDEAVAEQYGGQPRAVVRVQVEQLRRRLTAFARWQAERAKQGWTIEHVEYAPEKASLMVDNKPMGLRGRIDRIDRNADDRWAIFDYKTSDTPREPDEAHRRDDRWVDLQLPLYRHLVGELKIVEPVLGYIVLPKDVAKTGELPAAWDAAALASADEAAAEVVRAVRKQDFWPRAEPPPPFFDEFAAICQDLQLRAPRDDAEPEADA